MTNQVNSMKRTGICLRLFSTRNIWIILLSLFVFVILNVLTTTSRLSFIVDVSMKMKSKLFQIINDTLDPDNVTYVNGTVRLHTYISREDAQKAYRQWLEFHPTNAKVSISAKAVTVPDHSTPGRVHIHTETGKRATQRNDSCRSCFIHNFNYLINNVNICKINSSEDIAIIILITTTHGHHANRDAIRSTWIADYKNNAYKVRYAFLLGFTPDVAAMEKLVAENEKHHDIIQEDFIDSYKNLTYKTMMAYKWVTQYCGHAACVMKTDDDMFVNVPNAVKVCSQHRDTLQSTVVGACSSKASPIRNQKSKWYASVESYPGKVYPGFCSGTGYMTSSHVAAKVFEVSAHIPFFHLEDVYVSLCIKKLGYNLKRLPGFNAGRPRLDPCMYHGNTLVTSHGLNPLMLRLIWHKTCLRRNETANTSTKFKAV